MACLLARGGGTELECLPRVPDPRPLPWARAGTVRSQGRVTPTTSAGSWPLWRCWASVVRTRTASSASWPPSCTWATSTSRNMRWESPQPAVGPWHPQDTGHLLRGLGDMDICLSGVRHAHFICSLSHPCPHHWGHSSFFLIDVWELFTYEKKTNPLSLMGIASMFSGLSFVFWCVSRCFFCFCFLLVFCLVVGLFCFGLVFCHVDFSGILFMNLFLNKI